MLQLVTGKATMHRISFKTLESVKRYLFNRKTIAFLNHMKMPPRLLLANFKLKYQKMGETGITSWTMRKKRSYDVRTKMTAGSWFTLEHKEFSRNIWNHLAKQLVNISRFIKKVH